MMLSGNLHAVPDTEQPPRPWRAAAAGDADRAATTQSQFVDATRHEGVREVRAVLRGAQSLGIPADERHAMAVQVLAASVEKQARISGLGRITLPVVGRFA
jgi:hypothetical protein